MEPLKRTLKHVLLYDLCCAGVDTLCSFGKCDLPSEEDWLSCDLCDARMVPLQVYGSEFARSRRGGVYLSIMFMLLNYN